MGRQRQLPVLKLLLPLANVLPPSLNKCISRQYLKSNIVKFEKTYGKK
jgi:hypothetical protein